MSEDNTQSGVFSLSNSEVQWGVFDNLQELFPAIELEEGKTPKGFFMLSKYNDNANFQAFSIEKFNDPLYTSPNEDEIYNSLEFCFSDSTLEKTPYEGKYATERAGNRIAANTRRGVGRTIYKDFIFYHGPNIVDKIAQIFKDHEGTPKDGHVCVVVPKDAIIEYQDFDSCIYLLSLYDAKRNIFLVENNIGDGFCYKEKEIAYWMALPEIDGAYIEAKGRRLYESRMKLNDLSN